MTCNSWKWGLLILVAIALFCASVSFTHGQYRAHVADTDGWTWDGSAYQ